MEIFKLGMVNLTSEDLSNKSRLAYLNGNLWIGGSNNVKKINYWTRYIL